MCGCAIEAEDLFLVEVFDEPRPPAQVDPGAGELVLPARITSRFVLTWREQPPRGKSYQRTGMMVALGPRQSSVWVQPYLPRPGDGPFVLVDGVTEDDRSSGVRHVGAPRDYLSTEQWQRPRMLPRAVLRADRVAEGDGYLVRALHTDRRCPAPGSPFGPVTLGRARRVEECYVFRGFLHPWSRPPVDPGRRGSNNPYVRVCGICLKTGTPA